MNNPYQPLTTSASADLCADNRLFTIRAKLHSLRDNEREHLLRLLLKSNLFAYMFIVFGTSSVAVGMFLFALDWWMIASACTFIFLIAVITMCNNSLKSHRIRNLRCQEANQEIVFDGYADRYRLQSEHSEQYGSWLVLNDTLRDADRLLLLAPTLLDPVAVCLAGVDRIEDRTQQIYFRGGHSKGASLNELFPEQIFTHIHWTDSMVKFRGWMTSQHMRESDPIAWGIQRWQIVLSTCFAFAVSLTLIASYGSVLEDIGERAIRFTDLFFVIVSTALAFVAVKQFPLLLRAWRLLLSDQAKGSELEQFLSPEGIEVRSNGTHFRSRWAHFSNAKLLSDRVVATNQSTGQPDCVLSKSQFLTPNDWDLASQIAINSIPQSPSTPFREFERQSTI